MVFAPFSAHLWILTILAYLVTSLVFWLISRLSPLEQTECLWESLWGIISAFVYVSRPAPTVSPFKIKKTRTRGFYFFKTFSNFPNDKILSGMDPKFKKKLSQICTAKKILERLEIQTSSSFVKISLFLNLKPFFIFLVCIWLCSFI